MVRTKELSFLTPLHKRVFIRNERMKRGNTHVYRESKAASPSVSIRRTCFRGQAIPRFPHSGHYAQCYGSWTDPEETATAESSPVTGHLRIVLAVAAGNGTECLYARLDLFMSLVSCWISTGPAVNRESASYEQNILRVRWTSSIKTLPPRRKRDN
jgi:hypothetical protein